MRSILYFTATCASAFATTTVAQSCSAPPFYSNPAYGVKSGCIPTNYNSAADLGNTNPTDAATRCAQNCARASVCGGWVAQLNKAPDSGLYSGSCFLYTTLPATPRSCADKPSQLIAGVRDDTAKCFSSSSAAATAFCSSYLGIGVKTVMVTAPASTSTSTTTAAVTVPSTFTTVVPITIVDVSTTTIITSILTQVTNVVTVTVPGEETTTITVLAEEPIKKRAIAQPACVAPGIPASQLTEQCKCLSITSATTTATVTPAVVVVPATATTTATTAVPLTQTTLVTSFVVVTETDIEPVTETVTEIQTVTAPAPTD
jgi:hypothetical protein